MVDGGGGGGGGGGDPLLTRISSVLISGIGAVQRRHR